MKLLDDLQQRLERLEAQHLLRTRRVVTGRDAAQLQVQGAHAPLVDFCSNDYLGLARHPALAAALAQGAREAGVGSGASALISGHHAAHERLEQRFAALQGPHIPDCAALLFGTGYLANLAVLAALADADTEIFSERLNHASLIDGARLSRARVQVVPHADPAALETMLRASCAPRRIIVTDAVFSMDGSLAPLPRLLALAQAYDAWLVVDDAHGFGLLGPQGRGCLAHHGLHSPHLVYVATLGKAVGVAGALVAAHRTLVQWLVQRARTYVFTTAPPPALAYAVQAALDLVGGEEGDARRARLAGHVARLRAQASIEPWSLLPSTTAIQPVLIGDNARTMAVAAALQQAGLWVAGIRPPTVPEGSARLRITLSAAHEPAHIDRLASALHAQARRAGRAAKE